MFRTFLIVGLGSFFGGGLRYVVQQSVMKFTTIPFPFGTFLVNILGSFIIGYLFGISTKSDFITTNMQLLLLAGFCGGFTTFSSFSLETISLMRDSQYFFAFSYIGVSLLVGFAATFFAFKLA